MANGIDDKYPKKCQVVSSLSNTCLENILKNIAFNEDMFHILPQAVKTGLIKKLSLRGSLKHHHFKKVMLMHAFLSYFFHATNYVIFNHYYRH